ncbi:MFS transporter [Actinomadura welshii]|uniref:MFS transporter n=1 Tax=Actinomadura welshii TaxID=3103817 RepID=UPI000466DF2E|nr:MFS transporter [Actinomadura madurae]
MSVPRVFRTGGSPPDHALRAVVVEGFTTRLAFGVVIFAMPLYARQLGMSLAEIGVLVAMKPLVELIVKPFMGWTVDRWGARRGYLTAVTVRLVASMLLFTAATPASLYLVRLVQGAASAARDPASISVVAGSGTRKLGRAFSISFGAKDLGAVSAGALGGLLLAMSGNDFRLLWGFVVAVSFVPVLVVWRWVPRPEPRPPDTAAGKAADTAAAGEPVAVRLVKDPPRGRADPGSRVFRDSRLRLLCALGLLAGMTAHMTHGLFPLLAAEIAGLSPGQIGGIYSASVLVLLVVGPLAGLAADRFGAMPLTGARAVANTLSSLLYLVFPTAAGLLTGRLVDVAGRAAFRPPWGSLLAQAARRAGPRAGRVVATLDTALSVGEALGPIIAALLWDVWGLAAFLLVRAGLGIATELVVSRRLRHTAL